ncbi:Conserved_hypothetical protein [Hexamita inflata]|uniref:Uncharacterized protein n=1 Tax=Hexamita inflata TaxID=28002 RepID=A0AA86QE63_9EUKA|nr:Conserved hypothetical protein [Hexamita inflata]
MSVQQTELIYHIQTLNEASKEFQQVLVPMKLVDHIKSFKISVARAPIDSTIDIIRYFLKNMEEEFLPQLGDPRAQYASAMHRKLKTVKPVGDTVDDSLSFLLSPLARQQTIVRSVSASNLASTQSDSSFSNTNKKQSKQPLIISVNFQERITQLEKHLQIKLNPWKICCFEYVIRQLTEILLNFDPESCYFDKRIQHNYKLYGCPENKLSPKDLGLAAFFIPEQANRLNSWRIAKQILKSIHTLNSPSQMAFAMVLIYRNVEIAIGKLLEAEQYKKHVDKYKQQVQEQQIIELQNKFNAMQQFDRIIPQDLGMNFDLQSLNDEATIATVSLPQADSIFTQTPLPVQSFDDNLYEIDPEVPPFTPKQIAFGMDEMMPGFIYLVMEAQPKKLMRTCSLVENFCLPPIITNGAVVEFAMRTLQNVGKYVASGFYKERQIQFGTVKTTVKVKRVKYDGKGPLEM